MKKTKTMDPRFHGDDGKKGRFETGPYKSLPFLLISIFFFNSLLALEAASSKTALVQVPSVSVPLFKDDGDLKNLAKAAEQSWVYYSAFPPSEVFHFGKDRRTADELAKSMKKLNQALQTPMSVDQLNQHIKENFDVYKSIGLNKKGKVTYSSYYEHTFSASLKPSKKYRYPLYSRPPDLIDISVDKFDPNHKEKRWAGRLDGTRLVPYYSRREIDSQGILKGHGLEIAWAKDPLDVLFLQIQGSGWIDLPHSTETLHIRYAGDNGLKYRSIGRNLIKKGHIRRKDFNRSTMIEFFRKQKNEVGQEYLNYNPRYIFFEIAPATATTRGALLVSLTAERSIASDPKVYPPGALAWIKTSRPTFNSKGKPLPKKPLNRFVLNQDEGGAIKGAGRIDYFVGGGKEAELTAQNLWYPGELYFFAGKRRK